MTLKANQQQPGKEVGFCLYLSSVLYVKVSFKLQIQSSTICLFHIKLPHFYLAVITPCHLRRLIVLNSVLFCCGHVLPQPALPHSAPPQCSSGHPLQPMPDFCYTKKHWGVLLSRKTETLFNKMRLFFVVFVF